jgi:hypothetical protein
MFSKFNLVEFLLTLWYHKTLTQTFFCFSTLTSRVAAVLSKVPLGLSLLGWGRGGRKLKQNLEGGARCRSLGISVLVWKRQGLPPRQKSRIRKHTPSYSSTASFTISSNAFRTQEWSNLARNDVWRMRNTPPLVSFLVGWFGWLLVGISASHTGVSMHWCQIVGKLAAGKTQRSNTNSNLNPGREFGWSSRIRVSCALRY